METGGETQSRGMFGFLWNRLPTLRQPLPNPGKYEDYNQEARSNLQVGELFDGLKFELNKGLSQVFALNHTITLGSSQAPGGSYEFGANYATPDNKALLISRVDTSGNLQARVHYQVTPQMLARWSAMMLSSQNHGSQSSLDVDYRGADWCGTTRIGTGGRFSVDYLQSVTQQLSVGVAAEYQARIYGHARHLSAVSGCFRYNTNDFVATGQCASNGATVLSYTQRVRENVSLSSELQVFTGSGQREAQVAAGMEYRLRVGAFKAFITSTGHGTAYMEKKLNPEVSFVLAGDIDPKKAEHKFGIGLVVGGQ